MAIKMNMKAVKLAVISVSCGILSACGGDAGNPITPPPVVSFQSAGWWSGITNTSVPISTLIIDSGAYYNFYASQGSNLINGVIIGTGTEDTSTGVFSSTNGLDINFAGNGVVTAQLTSNFVPKTSLNTTITYPGGSQFTINSAYNPSYDQTPSISTVSGNYLGDMVVVDNFAVSTNLGVNLVIGSNGVVTISNASVSASCGATGNIVPHGSGNVYDINMTFNGSGCPSNVGAMNGNVFLDPVTSRFYSVSMNSTRASGLIFVGTQQ